MGGAVSVARTPWGSGVWVGVQGGRRPCVLRGSAGERLGRRLQDGVRKGSRAPAVLLVPLGRPACPACLLHPTAPPTPTGPLPGLAARCAASRAPPPSRPGRIGGIDLTAPSPTPPQRAPLCSRRGAAPRRAGLRRRLSAGPRWLQLWFRADPGAGGVRPVRTAVAVRRCGLRRGPRGDLCQCASEYAVWGSSDQGGRRVDAWARGCDCRARVG